MKSKRFETLREFWDTIDEWTDPTIQHAIFHENAPNHEEFYEECLAHDKWTAEIENRGLPGFGLPPLHRTAQRQPVEDKGYTHTLHEDNLKTRNDRWFAIPTPETFPKISNFFENNKIYVLSKDSSPALSI